MPHRVLVTGAAGFVGQHLVAALRADDVVAPVTAWRRADVDLVEAGVVHRAVAALRPTHVYHCAGAASTANSWRTRAATLRTNVIGTQHLLDALQAHAPGARVLIPGSAFVYHPKPTALTEDDALGPINPYGVSKLAQEMLARRVATADGLDIILTRSFTHIGPGQGTGYAASSFASRIARIETGGVEPVIDVGALDARRDILDIRDTVAAYRALMNRGRGGTVYNVCSGTAHPMQTVLDRLLALSDRPIGVRVDAARLRPSDYPLLLGDNARLTGATGWRPTVSLDEALARLLDDWRARVRKEVA
ncbi:MAG: NAD-dependent epimerase/dehydratase family protein [Acidobacteria bacterium]|nr:NAD-dependent epimerase/dehydratase family protein [Acidobacteriota bacterium]